MEFILAWIGCGLIGAGAEARALLEDHDLTYLDLLALMILGVLAGPVFMVFSATISISNILNGKVAFKKRGKDGK
jgi:hypothetical protein